jgi:phospholipid-binding lipoprotein MlaA
MSHRATQSGLGLALLAAAALFTACATPDSPADPYADPWEPMNRKVFAFNDGLDVWVLEPAARGWDYVMPDPVEASIHRFFDNLRFPVVFVNDFLQAKPEWAIMETFRFVVNSSIGVAGFFDPATPLGLIRREEDFGQTLAVYGVPSGPFLMLPLLGPSNPRDAGGIAADAAIPGPLYLIPFWATAASRTVNIVNQRSRFLEDVAEAKRSSVDYYAFVRNGYIDYRRNQISDGEPTSDRFRESLYEDIIDEDE